MYHVVIKNCSPLLEIKSQIKLKSNIDELNLLIGNRQSGVGRLTYLCLLTYKPIKNGAAQEHLQALTALS